MTAPTAPISLLDRAITRLSYGQAIGLVTAIGAVLRLAFIARQPIGYDEDFSAVVLHQPIDRMMDILCHDSAPPLFYILDRAVVAAADLLGLASAGGPGGPVALRLTPVLAGIALIPLVAALARRVGGEPAGVWAAAFTALVPTAAMLSNFARMYGLAATLTLGATLLLWRAIEKPGLGRWAAYAVTAAAAVWTDYFSAVALAGILVAALWLRPGRRVAAAAAVAWRQRLGPEAQRAALFCLLASSGVAILAVVSIWRPLLDARYAGVTWLPLFALAGVGLAALPRRPAILLVAAVAAPTLALSAVTTHAETSSLVPELEARVGEHDIVAASWTRYLVLLDEAAPAVQARLHVLIAEDPPWYVGTAAYPAGAVIHEVPADVAANRGRVLWVADPGVAPPTLPAGYHSLESRCVVGACLTVYGPGS